MAVMDEFKEERERMKQEPFKKRMQYFWDYHKWHVIIITAAVLCIISLIYSSLNGKETAFMLALIDCSSNEGTTDEYKSELAELFNIDTNTQDIILDNSFFLSSMDTAYASSGEVFSLRIVAEELHAVLSPEDVFNRYVQNDIFRDIRGVLSPEQLAYYEDSFYYVDYAVIESEDIYNTDFTTTAFVDNANHHSPEGMKKPIAVGIYVTGTEEFQGHYYFMRDTQEVVFALPFYVEDATYALQFLDHMTGRVE